MAWSYRMPVEVIFGVGEAKNIQNHFPGGEKSVLVTDKSLNRLLFLKELAARIRPAAVFEEVNPNPTVNNVDSLTALLRKSGADRVMAVGGGSVMDCAKAACSLAVTDEPSIAAYHTGGVKFELPGIPLTVLPTTAGTGSEVTPFAVLDDTEKGVKGPIASDFFYPRKAVVDPELTFSLPLDITASGGLDALSHALEGFWSKNHQPLCDLKAEQAARLVFENLPKVYADPADKNARSCMSYAALLAGMAFQLPKNAMVHACSFPLSGRYHMPHGTACAFTLDYALKLNAPAMSGRMERFALGCGFASIEAMAAAIDALKVDGGLPRTLSEAKIPASDIETLVEESFHPLMSNNPVEVTKERLAEMYRELNR